MQKTVFIGFDPPHPEAFAVCRDSLERLGFQGRIRPIWRQNLEAAQLYSRPTSRTDSGELFDHISGAAMTTEFAIARFFAPLLCSYRGLALFMDCDMLFSEYAPIGELFRMAALDPSKAVWCVKHPWQELQTKHMPTKGGYELPDIKMDGRRQSYYRRKNWSSFMLFNCAHPENRRLDLAKLNGVPGRNLHAFDWLDDDMIGELEPGWNWLVGVQARPATLHNTHWTLGGPWLEKFKDAPAAEVWQTAYHQWIMGKAHGTNFRKLQDVESEATRG